MTRTGHLRDEELLECAEGTNDVATIPHLTQCRHCQDAVAELRAVLRSVPEDVPEPSPLFWDHLSRRIRTAVAAEPAAWHERWFGWRSAILAGAAVAILALAVVNRERLPDEAVMPSQATATQVVEAPDVVTNDPSLVLLGALAQDLDWDSAVEAGLDTPSGTVEGAFTELTADEQAELRRILTEEISQHPGA
jgi:hypothetical protein